MQVTEDEVFSLEVESEWVVVTEEDIRSLNQILPHDLICLIMSFGKLEDKECELKELKRENADLKERLSKLEWKHGEEARRWVSKLETMRGYLKREEGLRETLLAEAQRQRGVSEAKLKAEKAAVEVAKERWKKRAQAAMKVPQAPKGLQ